MKTTTYTTQFNPTANGVAGYSITTTQQLGPVNNGYQSTTVGQVQLDFHRRIAFDESGNSRRDMRAPEAERGVDSQ